MRVSSSIRNDCMNSYNILFGFGGTNAMAGICIVADWTMPSLFVNHMGQRLVFVPSIFIVCVCWSVHRIHRIHTKRIKWFTSRYDRWLFEYLLPLGDIIIRPTEQTSYNKYYAWRTEEQSTLVCDTKESYIMPTGFQFIFCLFIGARNGKIMFAVSQKSTKVSLKLWNDRKEKLMENWLLCSS